MFVSVKKNLANHLTVKHLIGPQQFILNGQRVGINPAPPPPHDFRNPHKKGLKTKKLAPKPKLMNYVSKGERTLPYLLHWSPKSFIDVFLFVAATTLVTFIEF